jgi:hypothetical protein
VFDPFRTAQRSEENESDFFLERFSTTQDSMRILNSTYRHTNWHSTGKLHRNSIEGAQQFEY